MGWIGVDLDGTLADYREWNGPQHIGPPLAPMVQRVRDWLQEGKEVRIFTARATDPTCIPFVQKWCLEHIGQVLVVTCVKDFQMESLWDDRAFRVESNTGIPYQYQEAIPEDPIGRMLSISRRIYDIIEEIKKSEVCTEMVLLGWDLAIAIEDKLDSKKSQEQQDIKMRPEVIKMMEIVEKIEALIFDVEDSEVCPEMFEAVRNLEEAIRKKLELAAS